MTHSVRLALNAVLLVAAVALVLLAIIGGFRGYSLIPYWDMWGGYIGFYSLIQDGELAAWWAQHNEHRIVLAKILFWLDIRVFGGLGIFLIVVNYLLLLSIFAFFLLFLFQRDKNSELGGVRWVVGCLLLGWLFSWSQHENLTWGFQSQFFLAQLLPLSALFFQALSSRSFHSSLRYFVLAAMLGVLSVGTMANGVLILPLMTLLSLTLRAHWTRHVALAVLAVVTISLYFYNYVSPASHGSLTSAIMDNPFGVLAYVCTYVGGPFFVLLGGATKYAAIGAGASLIVAAALLLVFEFRKPQRSAMRLALLTFLLYVGGSAAGTAGGRLIFGLDQALSSRYMTPALMAWAALLVLLAPNLAKWYRRSPVSVFIFAIALLTALGWQQRYALVDQSQKMSERRLGALAAVLGIADEQRLGVLFSNTSRLLQIAHQNRNADWSIFALEPLSNAYGSIGTLTRTIPGFACTGSIDDIYPVVGESDYLRVRGWLLDSNEQKVPSYINILDNEGVLVGLALTGFARKDVNAAIVTAEPDPGFEGYVLNSALDDVLHFEGADTNCHLPHVAIQFPFHLRKIHLGSPAATVTKEQVSFPTAWTGSDSPRSRLDGLQVLGSWTKADSETGHIEIKVKRSDRLMFKSGPVSGRQLIRFNELGEQTYQMPVSIEWSMLEFTSDSFPEEFTITLFDNGDGWGEWSAVAVKTGQLD